MNAEVRDTCLYIHTRADDGLIFYVGIGTEQRPYVGCSKRSKWWSNVAAKHGYEVSVLLTELTRDEACQVEKMLIAEFRSEAAAGIAKLVNKTGGGDGATKGWSKLPENAEWLAKLTLGAKNKSPEWRAKIAESIRRRFAHIVRKVRHVDPEWRAKKAERLRARCADSEFRARNAEIMRAKWVSTEFKARNQVGRASCYTTAPHSRLNPQFYPWLYVWSDGKVYAKPYKQKTSPAFTDEV